MSIEESRIENPEEALIAAEAERPVRDMAREEGVDKETKEVFDRRAEQRGEVALDEFRDKKESLKGLVNPELHEFKTRLAEINAELEKEFGGKVLNDKGEELEMTYVPRLNHYKFNDQGELIGIGIDGFLGERYENNKPKYYGVGPLGKKLEADAIANRGVEKQLFILDAYKYDPEAKVLIDRLIELSREANLQRTKIKGELENIKRSYDSAENVNKFLERIGVSKRIPDDFNPGEAYGQLRGALRSQDTAKVDEIGRKLVVVFKAFDGLKITKEMEDDFGENLGILRRLFRDIFSVVQFSSDREYPKESKQAFLNSLEASETGKSFVDSKDKLYELS